MSGRSERKRWETPDGLTVDGVLGPKTREAVKHADASALAFTICALRLADYGLRGRTGKVARKYLDGWINRVRDLMTVL